jgi:ATP-dependent RNA helicase DHX8/PRP22
MWKRRIMMKMVINDYDYEVVNVFRFGEKFDWEKIYNLIVRERCRFEEGLPIYAYRREILQQIHHQKVLLEFGN